MTYKEQIEELFKLDEKRSPKEWKVVRGHPSGNQYYSEFKRVIMAGDNSMPIGATFGDPRSAEENEANAQFMAQAPQMMKIIKTQYKAIEKFNEQIEKIVTVGGGFDDLNGNYVVSHCNKLLTKTKEILEEIE